VYLGGIPDPRYEDQSVKAVTAGDGSFVLEGVPPGDRVLGVRHPEFVPTSVPVTVGEQNVTKVTIRLDQGGSIVGRVTENGVASPGSSIILTKGDGRFGDPHTRTDTQGFYELRGLGKGTWALSALLRGSSGTGPLQSTTVQVEEGRVVEHNFDFKTGNSVLEGYITENGEPISGIDAVVFVFLAAPNESSGGRVTPDANGFYRIEGLPAGSCHVAVVVRFSIAQGGTWSVGGMRTVASGSAEIEDGETTRLDIEIGDSAR